MAKQQNFGCFSVLLGVALVDSTSHHSRGHMVELEGFARVETPGKRVHCFPYLISVCLPFIRALILLDILLISTPFGTTAGLGIFHLWGSRRLPYPPPSCLVLVDSVGPPCLSLLRAIPWFLFSFFTRILVLLSILSFVYRCTGWRR